MKKKRFTHTPANPEVSGKILISLSEQILPGIFMSLSIENTLENKIKICIEQISLEYYRLSDLWRDTPFSSAFDYSFHDTDTSCPSSTTSGSSFLNYFGIQ